MREQKRVYCRPALVKHLRVMYNIGIASMFTIHQTLPHICAGLNTKYKPGVFHSTDGKGILPVHMRLIGLYLT